MREKLNTLLFRGIMAGTMLGSALGVRAMFRAQSQTDQEDFSPEIARFLKAHPEDGVDHYRTIQQLDEQGENEIKTKAAGFPKLVRGDTSLKTIALTFDDGPYPQTTPRMLAILKQYGVRATMFNIGIKAKKYPELIRAEVNGGNELANHTLDHVRLPSLKNSDMIDYELRKGAQALHDAAPNYKLPDICRPPGGEYDSRVIRSVTKYKYTVTLWTDDPGDYEMPGHIPQKAQILHSLIEHLDNGAIVLLHDGVRQTLDALPDFIKYAKGKGYKFVTCSEMLKEPHPCIKGGPNTFGG